MTLGAKAQVVTVPSIALEKFDWQDWLNSDRGYALETVGYWAAKFEEDYFSRRQRTQRSETTWKVEYQFMFKRLPSEEKLSGLPKAGAARSRFIRFDSRY